MIQAGGSAIRSEIHKRIYSIWNREGLPEQWEEFIRRTLKQNIVIIEKVRILQLH